MNYAEAARTADQLSRLSRLPDELRQASDDDMAEMIKKAAENLRGTQRRSLIDAIRLGAGLNVLKERPPPSGYSAAAAALAPDVGPSMRAKLARLAAAFAEHPKKRVEMWLAGTVSGAIDEAYGSKPRLRRLAPGLVGAVRAVVEDLPGTGRSAARLLRAAADLLDAMEQERRSGARTGVAEHPACALVARLGAASAAEFRNAARAMEAPADVGTRHEAAAAANTAVVTAEALA